MSINNCCVPCERADLEDERWISIHKRFLQDGLEKDPESNLCKKYFAKIVYANFH